MNDEIGGEAALFPEKEYINGIFVTVQRGFWIQIKPSNLITGLCTSGPVQLWTNTASSKSSC
jgi:hypothetical protein